MLEVTVRTPCPRGWSVTNEIQLFKQIICGKQELENLIGFLPLRNSDFIQSKELVRSLRTKAAGHSSSKKLFVLLRVFLKACLPFH